MRLNAYIHIYQIKNIEIHNEYTLLFAILLLRYIHFFN